MRGECVTAGVRSGHTRPLISYSGCAVVSDIEVSKKLITVRAPKCRTEPVSRSPRPANDGATSTSFSHYHGRDTSRCELGAGKCSMRREIGKGQRGAPRVYHISGMARV
jgi:hypothetical protein